MLNKLWKKSPPIVIGIDIGSTSIKMVVLQKIISGFQLLFAHREKIANQLVNDDINFDIPKHSQLIKQMSINLPVSAKHTVIAVSGKSVINKIIHIDNTADEHALKTRVEQEITKMIPCPIEEVSYDFEVIPKSKVLISIAKAEAIAARVTAVELAGLQVKVVDVEAYALGHIYAEICCQLPKQSWDKTVCLLDIGASHILLSIIVAGQQVYSEELTGIDSLIVLKQSDEQTLNKHSMVYHALIERVKQCLHQFYQQHDYDEISYLCLSGGIGLHDSLLLAFEQLLAIKVIRVKPFTSMKINLLSDNSINHELSSEYTLATSLAIRGFNACHT